MAAHTLQVLLFFDQIHPGADPGRGINRSRGVPVSNKLRLETGRLRLQFWINIRHKVVSTVYTCTRYAHVVHEKFYHGAMIIWC